MKLLNEFVKNLKIMFRNWTSISLLIIVPLIMILLIGYAFSNEEVKNINIGVISNEKIDLTPLEQNISSYGIILQYESLNSCLSDLALQNIHLCIDLKGIQLNAHNITTFEDLSSGKVGYYYDNSRKKVSLVIIQKVQNFFGLRSDQMSIESAEKIIENIQQLVFFINERKQDIVQIKNESLIIKTDLIERKKKLEQVRDDFNPSYIAIKQFQTQMHNYSAQINETSAQISGLIDSTILAIEQYKNYSSNINSIGTVVSAIGNILNVSSNLTNQTVQTINSFNNTEFILALVPLEDQLREFKNTTSKTTDQLYQIIAEIDNTIGKIDSIKIILDEEIQRNNAYITKIDQSIVRIDAVIVELDSKMSQLSKLNPGMAEKLVRPISYEYNLLLSGAKNIQLSFPQLLVIIIMFISLLFANIVALLEIHNRAYLRNLIAPVDDLIYMVGVLVTSAAIIFFQIFVLFIVADTRLEILIWPVFWKLALVTLLLILFFAIIGIIIAYGCKTIQSAILITTFTALTFFLFSNTMAPVETMPDAAKFVSNHNPIVIGEFLIKQIQLFDATWSVLWPGVLLLLAYIVALLGIAMILAKQRNKSR